MIRSLAAAGPAAWGAAAASRQKKDALFELASRLAGAAERCRAVGQRAISDAAASEKRKILRRALEMAAEGSGLESIAKAILPMGRGNEPGAALEAEIVLAGIKGLLAGEHQYVLMRRMSARLGLEYFDKTNAWLAGRIRKRKQQSESLLVPGEMPDVIRSLSLEPRFLDRCLRAAGGEIAAAALAGCPQESIELAKRCFGPVGGAMLEDDSSNLRSRLSGDEIGEAQSAFLEIVRSLEERGEITLGDELELGMDPAFVHALTRAIIAIDDRAMKTAVRAVDAQVLAMAMQGMEPAAHDRILGALSKREERRLLNALDDSNPLPRRAIHDAGRELVTRIRSAVPALGREAIDRLAKVSDWEG